MKEIDIDLSEDEEQIRSDFQMLSRINRQIIGLYELIE
jgi:hypothetical protein